MAFETAKVTLPDDQVVEANDDLLRRVRFERCIIDEFQDAERSTNSELVRMDYATFKSQVATRINAVFRWIISGTPFTHDADVVGTLAFLRHPMAEPLAVALHGRTAPLLKTALTRVLAPQTASQDNTPNLPPIKKLARRLIRKDLVMKALKPLVLRQFPRATVSQRKLDELGFDIKFMVSRELGFHDDYDLPDLIGQRLASEEDMAKYNQPVLSVSLTPGQEASYAVWQQKRRTTADGKFGLLKSLVGVSAKRAQGSFFVFTRKMAAVKRLLQTIQKRTGMTRG
jgi:hypothetical protein